MLIVSNQEISIWSQPYKWSLSEGWLTGLGGELWWLCSLGNPSPSAAAGPSHPHDPHRPHPAWLADRKQTESQSHTRRPDHQSKTIAFFLLFRPNHLSRQSVMPWHYMYCWYGGMTVPIQALPFAFLNSSTASGFRASSFWATSIRETRIFRSSVWNWHSKKIHRKRTYN